jgi:hypothetical protein
MPSATKPFTFTQLLSLSLLLLSSLFHKCSADDVENDISNEISENTRNVVFGIKCGACKAVTQEIGSLFKQALDLSSSLSSNASEKTVFRSKYVAEFTAKFEDMIAKMCARPLLETTEGRENGSSNNKQSSSSSSSSSSIANRWRYSADGAKAIQNSMMHINTLGRDAKENDIDEIQRVTLGIQLFTNAREKMFENPDPELAEKTRGTNIMADSWVTNELLDACARVTESLEFDDQIEEAKKTGEFGIDEQHKTCLELDYCKVRKGGAKAKSRKSKKELEQDEALERMKTMFVSKEDHEKITAEINDAAAIADSNDPLEETLDAGHSGRSRKTSSNSTSSSSKETLERERRSEQRKESGGRFFSNLLERSFFKTKKEEKEEEEGENKREL